MSAKISALKHAKKKLELFVCENIPQIVQFFPPRHHTFEWIARSPSFPTLGRSLPNQRKCQCKHLTFFATAREISPPTGERAFPDGLPFLGLCHNSASFLCKLCRCVCVRFAIITAERHRLQKSFLFNPPSREKRFPSAHLAGKYASLPRTLTTRRGNVVHILLCLGKVHQYIVVAGAVSGSGPVVIWLASISPSSELEPGKWPLAAWQTKALLETGAP